MCTGFLWDPEQEQHQTKGDIEAVEYDGSPRRPGPRRGESHVRADGTPHGFLVAGIRQREGRISGSYQWELEEDPDPSSRGGMSAEEPHLQ